MIKKNRKYYEIVKKVLDPTGQRTAKLCLTPYIFDRQFWNKMEAVTQAYANLLEFVFHEFPTNKKIQEVLEYPSDLEKFINSLNIYDKNLAAARIDIFVTKDGLRMVESNCEIPGANEESYFLEQEYLKIYQPENLEAVPRMEIVYNTLMRYYKIQAKYFGLPGKKSLTIYLAQWQKEIDRILGEYDIIMDFIRKRGHKCGVIDPNKIMIKNNKAFTPEGEQIDLIYRRFTADELPIFAEKKWQMAIDWDKADVAVVNPFCTKRVDSKNIMVLFKDEVYDDVFPENFKKDLEIVREIIPWTKKIKERIVLKDGTEVDARPYFIKEKDDLVIKHANAYSSAAVFIGEDIDNKKWEAVVEESLKGDWIVQEKIILPETNVSYWEDDKVKSAKCIYNVNPYIYDGKLGGFLNRASTDKLTSFKSGEIATIMPCFINTLEKRTKKISF
jgi:hypothetical protein